MDIYFYVIIALVLMATTNLWVGVANDAVNFLGSAVGSKAAPFKWILLVAAIGMVVGVTFSSGMMEVARKGIVHPEMFHFQEIIIIFLAYAIGDLILLDMFNTFGLPTSTTVSLIFGLLGAGVVISILKLIEMDGSLTSLDQYINTGRVLTFASAIIISIVMSFLAGSIVQYLSRMLFTFNYKEKFRRWGGIWSGVAITFIFFFILTKGMKGASFITPEMSYWLSQNTWYILAGCLIFSTLLMQSFILFTKINVLKIIVLIGTFSLAMAFASNDLVNFLGAPLAGISAYTASMQSSDPFGIMMETLHDPYKANTFVLLAAGCMMVFILYVSKKSKTVTKMSVSLGSQEEEVERFQSFAVSRGLVRSVATFFDGIAKITPPKVKQYVSSRFDKTRVPRWENEKEPPPAFDLIRASVNLMVAAGLISLGTSLKLPLSTTYVTFIVAMATAFSDRAWGRDSAVYRVSGVLTVVGGWFITAIMSAVIAGLVALIIWYFSFVGMAIMIATAFFLVFRTTILHKRREKEFEDKEKLTSKIHLTKDELLKNTVDGLGKYVHTIARNISDCSDGIVHYDLKILRAAKKDSREAPRKSDEIIAYIAKSVKKFDANEINKVHHFTDLIGYLNVLSSLSRRMTIQSFDYFDNNHKKLTDEQIKEIKEITKKANELMTIMGNYILNRDYFKDDIDREFELFKDKLNSFKSNQAHRVIEGKSSSWQNLLYLSHFDYCERMVLNSMKLGQALHRFFKS